MFILSILVGLLSSLIIGYILIPYLSRHANQRLSIYLRSEHENKKNTPTMGGLIFIIPTLVYILLLLVFGKIKLSINLILVLLSFILYALIGFIDDYLIIIKDNNKGLSENSKLTLQLIFSLILFYFFLIGDNEPIIWIHILGIKNNIGFLYGLFILLVLLSSSNALNITDGLDGLAGGLSIISIITLSIITFNTGWLEGYREITILLCTLVGSLIGFLFYNVHPAKVFMGDTGSLALGSIIGMTAILTRHELLLILIGSVFVIETLTCIMQRVYYKFTHKRIFPITPIHHTLERIYEEETVVRVLWLIGLISSLLALIYGVYI